MHLRTFGKKLLISCSLLAFLAGCGKDKSAVTGWNYNDPKNGGFEVVEDKGQVTGPNLVLIEGGTFTMGQTETDLLYEFDNVPRRVTVASFYMDETEVANVHYREYTYWLRRVFGAEHPEVYRAALPDTLVWRDELAYNEPYVEYYFRYPAYNYYPVVGVSWLQANEFCKWRTDRVNEHLLITDGYMEQNPQQVNEDNFNTESYLAGQYEGSGGKNMKKDLSPDGDGTRRVNMSDGVLLPDYRLPTEAEWEYAALALKGTQPVKGEELVSNRRIYPWDGTSLRYQKRNGWQGDFLANFKRGRGDMMGVAGALNDNAEITAPIHSNMPNDFGLYNMAGNVSEWVDDVYRPMTFADANDFNSYRGNVFMQKVTDEDGRLVPKDSMGRIQYERQESEDLVNRRNYNVADARNYMDGDTMSEVTYGYGVSTLISDKARVFKGGSWNDRAYWLSPGTRRYLNEDMASAEIGFRCAMSRMGSFGGQEFKEGGKQRKKNDKQRKY